jgi:lysophospholipase L1-like esterase
MISNSLKKQTTMKFQHIIALLAIGAISGCKPDIKPDTPFANGVNFSRYLAVGNSLTAGYSDGTLYRSGQVNSYPAMLADQFRYVGGGEFKQPLLPGEYGFPGAKLVLGHATDCMNVTSLAPVPYTGSADTGGSNTNISAQGPFNNFGIPFIRVVDYNTPGYAPFSASVGLPYAMRMFSNPGATALSEAMMVNPTFFTNWLGTNDVLGYALSGGEGNPAPPHPFNISDINAFKSGYDTVVKALISAGAKGALINIPDVHSMPFFTTIPANGLVLDTNSAAGLNVAYVGTGITFHTGANYFIVEDALAPAGRRHLKPGELILLSLPQDSLKCGGWGTVKPIPEAYVLSEDELMNISSATTAFNNHIHDEAIKYKLAYVDMNGYFKTLMSGIKFNGVDYNTQYITGGAFSLDGIHLTQRGQALAANQIISTINAYYGSTVPLVDINKYDGIRFP